MTKTAKIILAAFLAAALVLSLTLLPRRGGTPLPERVPAKDAVLLVPLDSRPPCRDHPVALGRIAGIDVTTPGTELLDYYSKPGETRAMQAWLLENARGKSAVILSIDQLLYGGLLAAREREASEADVAALIGTLRRLRAENPDLEILAFSILPRLQPQDSIDGYEERRDLVAYSRLAGKKAAGLAVDEAELRRLRAAIPPESLARYLSHFEKNERLNKELIALVEEGTVSRLVLGQDDGEPYGIPNGEKSVLEAAIRTANLPASRVYLTHGADEIAQTLLAAHARRGRAPLRFYIDYADTGAAERVMPYMAVSSDATIREKIALIGGTVAESPESADIVLAVSAGDYEEDTLAPRRAFIRHLRDLSEEKRVALIDLSRHFTTEETLLPLLVRADYPLHSLAAYAGWNTMSNAAGTAVAEAALYDAALAGAKSEAEALTAARAQTAFLEGRIIEDSLYLKDVIDDVNTALKKAGYHNTADLDLEHNHRWATLMVKSALEERTRRLTHTAAFAAPFTAPTPAGARTLYVRDTHIDVGYPWPRTFEVTLSAAPEIFLLH